jgi:spore germination protein GerM
VILALAAITLSAGGATAWFTWRSISPTAPVADFPEIEIEGEALPEGFEAPSSPPIEVPDLPETDIAANAPEGAGTVYWLSAEGDRIALAPSEIDLPAGESSETVLSLAFADLMQGPTGSGGTTTSIPEQTELLALSVESDGVHVNLSEDFTTGGGSASMIGRLAQVIYTATALEPDALVWISVAGEPLTLLGGEGLEVRQPMTRNDLATDFGVTGPSE